MAGRVYVVLVVLLLVTTVVFAFLWALAERHCQEMRMTIHELSGVRESNFALRESLRMVAVTFDPQSGHEQRSRRPALVVSNTLLNKHTGLVIVCPVAEADRRFPFHVAVVDNSDLTGFVMVEQVKSIDFRARKAKRIGKASSGVLDDVLSILDACIY